MVKFAKDLKDKSRDELERIVKEYDNREILRCAIERIRDNLTEMAVMI